jgi:hypothetical protein
MFHQGIVIYTTTLQPKTTYSINITSHDVTSVMIDGEFVQVFDRTHGQHLKNWTLACRKDTECSLELMVEAMGHVNYDLSMQDDRKGLIYFQSRPEMKSGWKMQLLNLN